MEIWRHQVRPHVSVQFPGTEFVREAKGPTGCRGPSAAPPCAAPAGARTVGTAAGARAGGGAHGRAAGQAGARAAGRGPRRAAAAGSPPGEGLARPASSFRRAAATSRAGRAAARRPPVAAPRPPGGAGLPRSRDAGPLRAPPPARPARPGLSFAAGGAEGPGDPGGLRLHGGRSAWAQGACGEGSMTC
ncbi:hypothetical protein VULLAG_LOCUS5469 [Vulpes lagopus]